jgi:zinc transporter ZupT
MLPTNDLLTAFGLLALLFASLEVGFRAGRRTIADSDARAAGQIGSIQGAILGLLGLLLAFSFSAAGTRFLERQDLIVTEANAIGTAYLRADLLDEDHRAELRSALKRYTEHRIELSRRVALGITADDHEEISRQHARIWSAASRGVNVRPEFVMAVLPPVNEVIDTHSLRIAAGKKHVPALVLGLLIASSALAIGIIGYGCGTGGKRRAPLTASLALLVGAALWITIDLDHPRAGLLRLSDAPLRDLKFDAAP